MHSIFHSRCFQKENIITKLNPKLNHGFRPGACAWTSLLENLMASNANLKQSRDSPWIQIACVVIPACSWKDEKEQRGRKKGQKATTKEEDKLILKTFHRLRPPGHYVDAQMVYSQLPLKMQRKITKTLVRRRLNAKGYYMEEKRDKDDPSVQVKRKRIGFCRKHQNKTAQHWTCCLQAVADLSEAWPA